MFSNSNHSKKHGDEARLNTLSQKTTAFGSYTYKNKRAYDHETERHINSMMRSGVGSKGQNLRMTDQDTTSDDE